MVVQSVYLPHRLDCEQQQTCSFQGNHLHTISITRDWHIVYILPIIFEVWKGQCDEYHLSNKQTF
jgi:hypothetical protein